MSRSVLRGLLCGVLCVSLTSAPAAEPARDSVDRDYSGELPRIPPQSPADALATFTLAPGFRLEQVAAEPLITDPTAIAFDENSRLYVIEMRDYSEDGDKNLGQIRLLEDRNGDGRFDHATLFAEGLSWPTAIQPWDGGVFVGAPPHLYYLKDTNGDGRADIRELVFTGFSRGNVQGMMNSFHFGLDNRLHGASGTNGGDIRPGDQPNAAPLVLRGRDFAFDPRTRQIAATSGGAQHGMSFGPWGEKYCCSNSDHIQLVLFDERYAGRNPYIAAPAARVSIAADGPQADVFRTSPVEPWRIVRTRLRASGVVPGVLERGGKAAGYFTGATGVTIFTGTAWPAEFYGFALVGDVGSNLVHRKRIEPSGVSAVARRVDEQTEFLSSRDIWFRPVQFANAPDGGLYVLDMYREVIEHPASLPPVIKKHLDLTSGRDRGRLYRVVGEKFVQPTLPQLGSATAAELATTLDHANGWHRETASRLLYQRQDRRAVPALESVVRRGQRPEGRLHALYALDGLAALTPETVLAGLADAHPRVRAQAVRLAERVAGDSPAVRERLFALAADEEQHVRYQLAFTLGELSDPRRLAVLAQMLRRDGADKYHRFAALSSLNEGAGIVLADLATDDSFRATPLGREIVGQLAGQIGRQQRSDDVAAVLTVLRRLPERDATILPTIVQSLAAKPGSSLDKQVAAATGGRAAEVLKQLVTDATAQVRHREAPAKDRAAAVALLRLGSFAASEELLTQLLDPTEPAEVQNAAVDTLGTFDDERIASLFIARWATLSPAVRSRAAGVVFSRVAWTLPMLDAVAGGKIAPSLLEPDRLKLLATHADPRVRERATKLASANGLASRAEVFAAYRGALEMKGDVDRGRAAFRKTCAACHQLEGVGHQLAPNLATMRNRGPEAILLNVLAPNQEVNPQYLNYVVILKDGRQLNGIIATENATSVVLKRADNATDTVLRIDIDELRSTGLSLMPEGLEKQVDKQAMADILEYLRAVP